MMIARMIRTEVNPAGINDNGADSFAGSVYGVNTYINKCSINESFALYGIIYVSKNRSGDSTSYYGK